jgi:hypothetical protein
VWYLGVHAGGHIEELLGLVDALLVRQVHLHNTYNHIAVGLPIRLCIVRQEEGCTMRRL